MPVETGPDWVLPDDVAWIDLTSPDREEELIAEKALGVVRLMRLFVLSLFVKQVRRAARILGL